ncbi:unnamed protein product [Brachionus calyciflorus]|uniref:Uncharacterized protein n=1 Tax=Brachionus calyciflorus TaxID=104777 RepID=A0A814CGN8_9BILA|nr:unnamed protein product [Brachionus calyciflorus]
MRFLIILTFLFILYVNFVELTPHINSKIDKKSAEEEINVNEYLKNESDNIKTSKAVAGWFLCDGRNGTPDLRGRFLLGRDTCNCAQPSGTSLIGGSKEVKINLENIPEHSHDVKLSTSMNGAHRHTTYYTSFLWRHTGDRIGTQSQTDFANVGQNSVSSENGLHDHQIQHLPRKTVKEQYLRDVLDDVFA